MMKRILSSLLSLSLLLTLSSCGGGPVTDFPGSASSSGDVSQAEETPDIPFTLAFYPEYSLHPVLAVNRANLTLAPLLYESLFEVDASFQARPVLCSSFAVSEDKLVWTFTLRGHVTFSDGTPLTGQAAADALELARAPGSRYQERLSGVASAAAGEAEDQLVITLRRPNGSLPLLLDIPIALGNGERPAGTGPYVLSEDGASLTAREGWWQKDKTLSLSSIPLHGVSKSDELIYAFDAGEISLVDVDLMATNAMGYGGNYQTWDYSTTDFLYLGFNTQNGLCRAPEVRRCLAHGVDRDAAASTAYASHARPARLPVHPDSPLYSAAAAGEAPDFDLEALASQAEERRLSGKTLVFLVNSENTAKAAVAQHIAYQLEAAGLTIELQQLSFEDFTAALAAGSFDLYLGETVLTADFDLASLLSSAGALNFGGWREESADGLIYAMGAASPEEKPAAAQALFSLLNQQMPIVPIAFKNGSVLTQWGRLSGLSPVRGNVFYHMENWDIK